MKKLLSLAMAGAAIVALNLPADAKPERGGRGGGRGGGGMAQAQARGQAAIQQAPRAQAPRAAMQSEARTRASANVQNRAAINQRATVNQRARVAPENRAIARSGMENRRTVDRTNRTVTRNQASVAFGGQNRRDFDRSDFRRDVRGRDFDRGDRFRRPPVGTWRNWDRGRTYSWDNHRWHWYNGAWVVIGASPYVSYYDYDYDEPYTTTYVSTSGSTVAAVQRELANAGYSPGPIDGVMGGATRSAIAAFQRDNGLAVTGNINAALLSELDLR